MRQLATSEKRIPLRGGRARYIIGVVSASQPPRINGAVVVLFGSFLLWTLLIALGLFVAHSV
jgi:hypothetical protein